MNRSNLMRARGTDSGASDETEVTGSVEQACRAFLRGSRFGSNEQRGFSCYIPDRGEPRDGSLLWVFSKRLHFDRTSGFVELRPDGYESHG